MLPSMPTQSHLKRLRLYLSAPLISMKSFISELEAIEVLNRSLEATGKDSALKILRFCMEAMQICWI